MMQYSCPALFARLTGRGKKKADGNNIKAGQGVRGEVILADTMRHIVVHEKRAD